MFFQNLQSIESIALKTGCSIFVVPNSENIEIKNAIILSPEEKSTITVEQARTTFQNLTTKRTEPIFILIRPADLLSDAAANAILKNLEEPKDNVHFVLLTENLTKLLPTIRSRAAIYIWKGLNTPLTEIRADEKIKALAKKLLSAKPQDLPALADEITKKKDGVRAYTLEILKTAIEIAYKSYLLTNKSAFLTKTAKLLAAHDSIAMNGHIKLHLVADLL